MCTDFQKLNALTEPDPFPLPRIDDLLDKVGKAQFLTKLDMAKGYRAIRCDDESIPMTVFVTPFGFFRWKYMPFGYVMLRQRSVVWFGSVVSPFVWSILTTC